MNLMDRDEWYDLKDRLDNGEVKEDDLDPDEVEAMSYDDWHVYSSEYMAGYADFMRDYARDNA